MSIRLWLRALWLRWRPQSKQAPPVSSPRFELMRSLRALHPELFAHYRSVHGQGLFVEVLYPHIDQYTEALREYAQTVRDDRLVEPTSVPRETFRVSVDRFMTSADGYYLQPVLAVQRFKTMASQLCEAMEASDYAEYGPAEHNLRMLRSVLTNLHHLTTQLTQSTEA